MVVESQGALWGPDSPPVTMQYAYTFEHKQNYYKPQILHERNAIVDTFEAGSWQIEMC